MRLLLCLIFGCLSLAAPAAPLATFTVKDFLHHRWADELVHFDFDVKTTAKSLTLVNAVGVSLPCQFTNLIRSNGRTKGTVWTVVTVEPEQTVSLLLKAGKAPASPEVIRLNPEALKLVNDRITVLLPRLPGKLNPPVALSQLPPPLAGIGRAGGPHYGAGIWQHADAPQVREATTRILDYGPVRALVEQRYTLVDDRQYRMTVQVALHQDVALITEDGNIEAPKTCFRLDMTPGLGATRVFWHNQWKETPLAKSWGQTETDVETFKNTELVCALRPWSFWWDGGITEWAGFYGNAGGDMVGVLALRPSRWSPCGGDGFLRTEIVVTARDGQPYLTCPLVAAAKDADGRQQPAPLHREWALTVGAASEHVDARKVATLRRQLIKYSEFPLDEVKDFGFDYAPSATVHAHPFLLMTQADIDRVRAQTRDLPVAKAALGPNVDDVLHCLGDRSEREGWESVYQNAILGNGLMEKLPEAYLASDNPALARAMAAAVKGCARDMRAMLLESPPQPALGAMGPWFAADVTRLLFLDDMMADTEYLTPAEKADIRATLVLGEYFLAHPDYWNVEHGLCGANPKMTAAILLQRGLVGLELEGHPRAADWTPVAEGELKHELADFIDAGGAWIEHPDCPTSSLAHVLCLMQALRNDIKRDYAQ